MATLQILSLKKKIKTLTGFFFSFFFKNSLVINYEVIQKKKVNTFYTIKKTKKQNRHMYQTDRHFRHSVPMATLLLLFHLLIPHFPQPRPILAQLRPSELITMATSTTPTQLPLKMIQQRQLACYVNTLSTLVRKYAVLDAAQVRPSRVLLLR